MPLKSPRSDGFWSSSLKSGSCVLADEQQFTEINLVLDPQLQTIQITLYAFKAGIAATVLCQIANHNATVHQQPLA
jgi:hypothetical protein